MSLEITGRLAAETARLRTQMEILTRQTASGQRSSRLGDLAPDVPRAVSLRAQSGRLDAYDRVLTQSIGRTEVMQASLSRLTEIARDFRSTALPRLYTRDPVALEAVKVQARNALTEMAHLLNVRHAGEYLFSGSDIGRPPIPDPEGLATGQMAQDVAAAVATLGAAGAASVLNDTRTAAQSNVAGVSPFSDFLQDEAALAPADREARRAAPAADGQFVAYGIFADRNAVSVSSGETTGSWARDLMRNLMSLAALDPAQMDDLPNYTDLLAGLRDGFAAAEQALTEEAGGLGQVTARLEDTQRRQRTTMDLLRGQIADIEEVDLASTLERLQATRTALEASYRAIGSLSELTLARFLR
ncbi:flagellin [Roseococcus microcysteis]|uniref:flagellin n=1 Tax=Roseococcus microcysteis TaxID=2771361 RepID=UPI00168AD137|nr:flagellin [Roseococcus microcysteis]